VLNYLLVRQVGATRAALAMFLMPVFAVFGGWAFLNERLGIHAFAGLGLILAGSFLVNGRFGRAKADERLSSPPMHSVRPHDST
jgi:drug/metabolite transporter (DMT)-like permease